MFGEQRLSGHRRGINRGQVQSNAHIGNRLCSDGHQTVMRSFDAVQLGRKFGKVNICLHERSVGFFQLALQHGDNRRLG